MTSTIQLRYQDMMRSAVSVFAKNLEINVKSELGL